VPDEWIDRVFAEIMELRDTPTRVAKSA